VRGALLKANRRDLRAFVHAVEALAPQDGDVAGFLDQMGASLASEDRTIGALELWTKAAKMYEEQGRLEDLTWLYANMGPIAAMAGDVPRGIRFSKKAEELAGQWTPISILHTMSHRTWEQCMQKSGIGSEPCTRIAGR